MANLLKAIAVGVLLMTYSEGECIRVFVALRNIGG